MLLFTPIVLIGGFFFLGVFADHSPATPAPSASVSLDRPVYLRKGAVICPKMDVLGAYLAGHQAGGEDEGHRAVQRLFLRAGGECIRTIDRDQVRVLDKDLSGDHLVEIQWPGTAPEVSEAFTRDLSN